MAPSVGKTKQKSRFPQKQTDGEPNKRNGEPNKRNGEPNSRNALHWRTQ